MKKMSIVLAVLISLAFCFGLAACGKTSDKIESDEIDEGLFSTIKRDYARVYEFDKEYIHFHYYGTYNDYTAISASPWGAQKSLTLSSVIVDDVYFNMARYWSKPYAPSIVLWKDGAFRDLNEAYSAGILTKEGLLKLVARHKATYPDYYLANNNKGDTISLYVDLKLSFYSLHLYVGENLPANLTYEHVAVKRISTEGLVSTLECGEYTVDTSDFDQTKEGIYTIYINYDNLAVSFEIQVYKNPNQ